eukprot:GDKJ01015404.1.p1 GENE.GDKJ01015404.1~~GDKJ01015404.1.p1  ORF type:complete len:261 (+),score=22.03 GDKJ01015404.1:106-888(+)
MQGLLISLFIVNSFYRVDCVSSQYETIGLPIREDAYISTFGPIQTGLLLDAEKMYGFNLIPSIDDLCPPDMYFDPKQKFCVLRCRQGQYWDPTMPSRKQCAAGWQNLKIFLDEQTLKQDSKIEREWLKADVYRFIKSYVVNSERGVHNINQRAQKRYSETMVDEEGVLISFSAMDRWCVENFGSMAYLDPFLGECFKEGKQITAPPTERDIKLMALKLKQKRNGMMRSNHESETPSENSGHVMKIINLLSKFGQVARDFL